MHTCKQTKVQSCTSEEMHTCRHSHMPTCKRASMYPCRNQPTIMHVCQLANIHTRTHVNVQTCTRAMRGQTSTHRYKHANTNTCLVQRCTHRRAMHVSTGARADMQINRHVHTQIKKENCKHAACTSASMQCTSSKQLHPNQGT